MLNFFWIPDQIFGVHIESAHTHTKSSFTWIEFQQNLDKLPKKKASFDWFQIGYSILSRFFASEIEVQVAATQMARHRQKAQSFRLLSNKWLNGKCESTRVVSVVLCFRVHSLVHCFRFIHAAAFIPSTWKSLFPWKFMRWIVCSFWFGREYRNVVSACAPCANDLIRIVKSNATHIAAVYALNCNVWFLYFDQNIYIAIEWQ